ncbi:MAG: glycoside hydrolase family 3 protein [Desulfovibrio sp.]
MKGLVKYFSIACVFLLLSGSAYALPSLERMAGEMLLVGFRGMTIDKDSPISRDIQQGKVGGVVLFNYDVVLKKYGRNVESPGQLLKLTTDLQGLSSDKLIISIDQEGGRVQRLRAENGFKESMSAQKIGEESSVLVAKEQGQLVGEQLYNFGINVNFAPVVDVNVSPKSPAIGGIERSFSSNPYRVYELAEGFIEGMHSENVLSCIKHFPGHGSSTKDSHLGVTDVTSTWSDAELKPYELLIKNGYADMIMTAHIFNGNLDADYPATLSPLVINGILRQRYGFDSVVISDDLQMKAIAGQFSLREIVRQALLADVDILLFGNNLEYDPLIATKVVPIIVDLVNSGEVKKDKIVKSYLRIQEIKNRLP